MDMRTKMLVKCADALQRIATQCDAQQCKSLISVMLASMGCIPIHVDDVTLNMYCRKSSMYISTVMVIARRSHQVSWTNMQRTFIAFGIDHGVHANHM